MVDELFHFDSIYGDEQFHFLLIKSEMIGKYRKVVKTVL